jgi:hypothetical protein
LPIAAGSIAATTITIAAARRKCRRTCMISRLALAWPTQR